VSIKSLKTSFSFLSFMLSQQQNHCLKKSLYFIQEELPFLQSKVKLMIPVMGIFLYLQEGSNIILFL